ncbi:Rho GTPase activation protein [Halteromyces radiatus]|uniref:Rho GTPase activation protein n=1 Tax=Halteromyces radiatus TaxID=101107 RepID=UPI0022204214|nr:Rho GTPase activation protein [Halteromyces radiatus]KAI8099790.1 Rho GTPase activation protein [Halteromyces radiatus]
MISNPTFSEKRPRNPIYYLWTKWNQSTQEKYEEPIQQSIFGSPLEHGFSLPEPVKLCFEEIIKRGLKIEGLFRLSGATSEVIQLKQEFERQQSFNTTSIDLSSYDIHSITSFIKKYLHHLPTAVIPVEYHDEFTNLTKLPKDQAIIHLIDLISSLPDQHRILFYAILTLTSHIQHYAHINMMNPEALAVVLAPVCTGLEKTIQMIPTKKSSKRRSKKQEQQQHYQQLNTKDIQRFIQTNTCWTLLWKWMIEENDTILSSTNERFNPSLQHLDHTSIGSPPPPPPLPSLLFWSTVQTNDRQLTIRKSPSRIQLKHKPSSPSILSSGVSLCQKSSHGFLRRLASVSSLR